VCPAGGEGSARTMGRTEDILTLFHPLVARWFGERVGEPTDVQRLAWPKIAAGEHVLVTAPTGSGKTLTAFLWALDRLIGGHWPTGRTSVLYVSPLKALNNDIRRNLLTPLAELRESFAAAGEPLPDIQVLTRSGDTPQSDRRRMLRRPPEVLITTPESLNILLSSAGGRGLLGGLATVILDEVHAVIGNKRGTHLITAVERLVRLSGEFQRIALSATVRPMATVAEFVGGFRVEPDGAGPRYKPRPVTLVRAGGRKRYDVRIRLPAEATNLAEGEPVWGPLADEFRQIIERNRSTLLFANSRRLVEKLTLLINAGAESPIAYAHHGSLAKEVRQEVERKLKAGDLKAIVATNSLEMGIDIGSLDEVVLVQSPFAISSGIQRVGRAGHQVGEVSRAELFPSHARDFLDAAVLVRGILEQDIEPVRPVRCPLDVLAQVIVSMTAAEAWRIDELFAAVRASWPFRRLARREFDLVLEMLAGRYEQTRVRELRARVSIDRLDGTVVARPGALQALYASGGVIPDRGYFTLRHQQTNARIGELDEEFVWEASIGQTFSLGTQHWQVQRITHNDVLVVPGTGRQTAPPFWIGEEVGRDAYFSRRVAEFLEDADEHVGEPGFRQRLLRDHCMDEAAADRLIDLLEAQKAATGCGLPHRHRIVVEHVRTGPGGAPVNQVVLHTMWGGHVNRPFAMALDAAWEQRHGRRLEIYPADDCIVVMASDDEIDAAELMHLVGSTSVESLLRRRLEGSGFFGARFRECAGRALLVTRGSLRRRLPLWVNRLRSQKLLDAVLRLEDFPILLEAWRTCLQDEFEMDALREVLAELEAGRIAWVEAWTDTPSPLAGTIGWEQVNRYMYMTDELRGAGASSLRSDLLRDVVFTPHLRPAVARRIVEQFELKRQRLAPGYAPATPRDLLDWLTERLALPAEEWERMLAAIEADGGQPREAVLAPLADKLVRIVAPGANGPLLAARQSAERVAAAFWPGAAELRVEAPDGAPVELGGAGLDEADAEDELLCDVLGQWLSYYGPRTPPFVRRTLGLDGERLRLALADLAEAEKVIEGALTADAEEAEVCDCENFEILLRLARADAAPAFEPLEAKWLAVFLAAWQGLIEPATDADALRDRIERLICLPLPAAAWEADVLPARMQPYEPALLDRLFQEEDLLWVGAGPKQVAFCYEGDLDLLPRKEVDSEAEGPAPDDAAGLFPDPAGRYDFTTLLRRSLLPAKELSKRLWEGVWRGGLTNDAFVTLRRAVQTRFEVPDIQAPARVARARHGPGRRAFRAWKSSLPATGNWRLLPRPEPEDDLLEAEQRDKDRARLLLDRYGVVFREMLQREAEGFRWADVFRSLRLMELAGEALAGCFFHGVPGPQFASPSAFARLQRGLPADAVWWLNATDPASLCGLGLETSRHDLPRRLAATHLVYRGAELVVVSERNGRRLTARVGPDDPRLGECLAFLRHVLTRAVSPARRVTIETINDAPAAESRYVDALREQFDLSVDFRSLVLYRKREMY